MLTGSNNPYDILGIDRGADKKAIKRAYAQLVKQYHPEEQPEEWKRIHDAYEQAMEQVSAKKQKVSVLVPQEAAEQEKDLTNRVNTPEEKEVLHTPTGTPEQKEAPNVPVGMPEQKEAPNTPIGTPEQEKAPNTPIGMPEQKQVPNASIGTPAPKIRQEVPETEAEDIFGDVDEIAGRQREQEESAAKEKLESAIREMRQLIWDNKFQKKEWKKFFERRDLLPVISQKKFLRELGDCFELKQIDLDLYTYLNEQLEAIAEYIKEYNTDLTRSRDLAAVKYAKAKVRLAHKRYAKMREEQKEKFWGNWAVPIALVLMFIIGMVYVYNEEQRKEEEQQRWKQITEMQQESMQKSMEQQPIGTSSELVSRLEMLDMSGDIEQQLQEMLDEGIISQMIYDYLLQYSEIDRSGTEEETTEENTDADTK